MRKKTSKQRPSVPTNKWGEVRGVLLIGISIFLFLGLISYSPSDISFLTPHPEDPPHNYVGLVGAWLSFLMLILFGLASFLVPTILFIFGVRAFWKQEVHHFWPKVGLVLALLTSSACLFELHRGVMLLQGAQHFGLAEIGPGGMLGKWILRQALARWMGVEGSYILLYSGFLASLLYLLEVRLVKLGQFFAYYGTHIFNTVLNSIRDSLSFIKTRLIRAGEQAIEERQKSGSSAKVKPALWREKPEEDDDEIDEDEETEPTRKSSGKPIPVTEVKRPLPTDKKPKETQVQLELITSGNYQLPSLKLLDDAVGPKIVANEDLQRNAEILKTTLAEFGVEVEVVNITKGPVITRYELQPAPGLKVQKIVGLSNDIALAMKAASVRIVAPIPGKAAVGVEIPNNTGVVVYLKELLSSDEFKSSRHKIPLALGKDVTGVPIVADLTEMPHLLIAGATGSGKSICMSSIILNILFYASPDYIRFLLIDPKMVELSLFNNLPHLAFPVITDSKKAAAGLAWLVTEMERRYKVLAEVGVRNIENFNERVVKEKVTIHTSEEPLKPLPYIVVVIDELADLMMVAAYEVENSIARLAQLARAIGIHLILATQRPSVDVITGVIKANFPARISFQVSSKVDSRTVLDAIGAEKLVGKGDLLFMPPGSSKLVRAQGAYIKDTEIKRVLDFIKGQNIESNFNINAKEVLEKAQSFNGDISDADDETVVEQAIQVIKNTNQASVSVLQRKLKIGYSRAARIMDLLEERGVVGPYKGSKARDILIDIGAQEV